MTRHNFPSVESKRSQPGKQAFQRRKQPLSRKVQAAQNDLEVSSIAPIRVSTRTDTYFSTSLSAEDHKDKQDVEQEEGVLAPPSV